MGVAYLLGLEPCVTQASSPCFLSQGIWHRDQEYPFPSNYSADTSDVLQCAKSILTWAVLLLNSRVQKAHVARATAFSAVPISLHLILGIKRHVEILAMLLPKRWTGRA